MLYGRREMMRLALGALPATHLARTFLVQDAKPNSSFGGVQIGIIAPYAFRGTAETAEDILKRMIDLGISADYLKREAVEPFAGAPSGSAGSGRRRGGTREATEELRDWRESVSMARSMAKFEELREMYEDEGVGIYAFKMALVNSSDGECDYCFQVAKALGANHVTMELNDQITERIGRIAASHRIHVGYHNHAQVDEHSWDEALAQSDYNGINLDVGHFTAAISKSAIPFIEKHHARIHSMHFKDRRFGTNGSENMPWGQGDTPLREVLHLMKREQYRFPATIELEYTVPEGSTVKAELRKCLQFCKDALT